MGRRWWLLFRSLAVITVLFLAPILAVRKIPLRYFLSTGDVIAQFALQILVLLLLEALLAAFFTLMLSAAHALQPWSVEADDAWAGFLALASALICLLVLISPFGDSIVNASVSTAVILAVIGAATLRGWRPTFALFNRLNQSAQMVLAACPLLLIPIMVEGLGWRSFDPIPVPRQFTPNPLAKPNVVLISFDAMSAQDMSLYGYQLATTPQFERLAQRSYKFANFYSTSDFTSPAAASMLDRPVPAEPSRLPTLRPYPQAHARSQPCVDSAAARIYHRGNRYQSGGESDGLARRRFFFDAAAAAGVRVVHPGKLPASIAPWGAVRNR